MTVVMSREAGQRGGAPPEVRTVPPVHPPTVGLVAQLAVLAVLAAWVGLGVAGWLVAGAYAIATWLLLTRALQQPGVPGWGPADTVTMARATLVGGVVALVMMDSLGAAVPVGVLVGLAAVALALDGVDGQVARRTGTATARGARFDVEIDSVLVLVLSAYVAQSLGWWVVAIGAARYGFVAAAWLLPWLHATLPPRWSRKAVAATQGIVLAVASSGLLPEPLTYASVGLALSVLAWSFGRDIGWLWRLRVGGLRVPARA